MDLNLRGHVAAITGAASGIGRAIAEGFAAEGCRVALWDVSPRVREVAAEIAATHHIEMLAETVDIAEQAAVERAVARTEEELGPIDHVVHSAAIGSGKFGFPFTNLTPEDWRRPLEINILGMVHVAHACAPRMVERKAGTMVFIASVAGQIGSQTDPPYSAAKAANINFAQCIAKDLAPHGIRVNSVCPGMVQTPLNKSVWQAWNDQQPPERQMSYETWAEAKIRAIVPLGRWQSPQDVADMVVFLSSARAGQVTGQTINVDGGYVIR